jgi:hypothetical protein
VWRDQARHLLAVSRDNDFLTAFDQIEQLTELVFGLEGPDFTDRFCLRPSAGSS